MHSKFTFLMVILLLAALQSVIGQTNEPEPDGSDSIAGFASNAEGKRYSSNISRDDVRNTPSWDSLSEKNPPLSVKDAVGTAQNNLKQFVSDLKDWEVSDIRLIPLVISQKWIYLIEFRCNIQKTNEPEGDFFRMIVKMDGRTVKPELLIPETENPGIPSSPKN